MPQPLPPIDPYGPDPAPWDENAPEPELPRRQAPPPPAPVVERPPQVPRLDAIKALLHMSDQVTTAQWQAQWLLNLGWQGEQADTQQVRRQLEIAARELQWAARRFTGAVYLLQSLGMQEPNGQRPAR